MKDMVVHRKRVFETPSVADGINLLAEYSISFTRWGSRRCTTMTLAIRIVESLGLEGTSRHHKGWRLGINLLTGLARPGMRNCGSSEGVPDGGFLQARIKVSISDPLLLCLMAKPHG